MRGRLLLLWALPLCCCFAFNGAHLSDSQFPDLTEVKKTLRMNSQRCASAHQVQLIQVLTLMEAPIIPGYDRNPKCFICCMMEKYQMLTSDGEFLDGSMRKLTSVMPPSALKDVAVKFLDTCLREDNDDVCEKCYQFAKCFYDRSKTKNNEDGQQENQQFGFNTNLNPNKKLSLKE